MSKIISCCAIIPARIGSSRFPGKPLAQILGKPMIQRTYENTLRHPDFEKVWIATDDSLIAETAKGFGAPVLMTSVDCQNGTERLIDSLRQLPEIASDALIVNVQGDEPLVDPLVIDAVISGLRLNRSPMATVSVPLQSEAEYLSRSVVKCVANADGLALYFSRASLGNWSACQGAKPSVRRHVGIYGYRRWFLEHYGKMAPTPLQIAEDLEQLRVLEHGMSIQIMPVEHQAWGVDVPEDIAKVEQILMEREARLGGVPIFSAGPSNC